MKYTAGIPKIQTFSLLYHIDSHITFDTIAIELCHHVIADLRNRYSQHLFLWPDRNWHRLTFHRNKTHLKNSSNSNHKNNQFHRIEAIELHLVHDHETNKDAHGERKRCTNC